MKRLIKVAVIVILVLIILFYPAVVVTNNIIADNVEKELKIYELPENTELVDSFSLAGKYTGNGNGMQYLGTLLLTSELSREEIEGHYKERFEYIYVAPQTGSEPEFIRGSGHHFKKFGNDGNYYCVALWGGYIENDRLREILDVDLRGH